MNPHPNRELNLQAYDGTMIPNHIDPDPTQNAVQFSIQAMRKRLIFDEPLGPPTGRYNCHGLVFASRRTNIRPGSGQIEAILKADQFELVESPQVGDVILYRYPNGSIEHSGIVTRIESVGRESVAFVWSKWGALGEYHTRQTTQPYDELIPEYWRLKR